MSSPRSSKAKGKALERWLRDKLFEYFPELTEDDIRVPIGQESGSDIKLSMKARELLQYDFECKNRETFNTLYGFYEQSAHRCRGSQEPVVILKMNRKKPLALIDAELFLTLIKEFKP